MKKLTLLLGVISLCAFPALAQQRGGAARGGGGGAARGASGGGASHVGGGYIPAHGPTKSTAPRTAAPKAGATAQKPNYSDAPGHPSAPHVHPGNGKIPDKWVGHDTPNDPHYHLDHPWQNGHFPGAIGASHVWRIEGGGPSRFWFGGFYFSVAPYDLDFCSDWLWGTDDIVIYPDPDDIGWYIAYNVRLGTFVHIMYLGT